jgi:hypothetical protein
MSEAVLDEWIAKLRSFSGFVEGAAPELAEAMRQQFERQVNAGTAPDGTPWKLTKEGDRPLKRAMSALAIRAVGTVILATLTGHHAIHHYGTKKDPTRQVLPTSGMPATLAEAFRARLVARFNRTMGGR